MKAWHRLLALGIALAGALTACSAREPNIAIANNQVENRIETARPTSPRRMTLAEAVDAGAATFVVTGHSLQAVKFTVTAMEPLQVTLGSGMLVTSSDPATQNMVTAESVEVSLEGAPDAPVTREIVVPAFCINRYRATPGATSSFSLTEASAEQRPLQALARCLAGQQAEHEAKQDAIWVISDGWAHMTADQYVADRLERIRSQVTQANPDQAEEVMAQAPDYLRADFERLRATTGPLLARCGHTLADLPMFA